jgi:hypothetical protein
VSAYQRLPIVPEEGFPHSFRLDVGDGRYAVALYVNVIDAAGLPEDHVFDLTLPGALMIMTVRREGTQPPTVIFRRRVVTGIEYRARELAFLFRTLRVDRRNLNGIGAFGSDVTGGVALRWGS